MKKIKLTQDKTALVDDEDFDRANNFKWHACGYYNTFYAIRNVRINGKATTEKLHRFILNAPPNRYVDHRNRDGLDCRKSNLRLATNSQNIGNSCLAKNNKSGFKGVFWRNDMKMWRARVKCNAHIHELGHFDNVIDAALAYDQKARELFGEFARTNFQVRPRGRNG